jgi:hypothetical protein
MHVFLHFDLLEVTTFQRKLAVSVRTTHDIQKKI